MEVPLKMWVIEKLKRALQQVFFRCDDPILVHQTHGKSDVQRDPR